MIIKIFILTLLIALSISTRDHLTITEYNSAIDATIRNIADPVYRQLPLQLNNYSYEIFPPKQPGDHPLLLIRYNPPRFNVVLTDVHLNSIGSINREGECVIPDKNKQWEVNCWYKFKNIKFTAIGKQGQKFSEELDVTMAVASYKWRSPNEKGQIWHLWAPWAPGSVEFRPMIHGSLSPELKQYLEDNKEDLKRFLEYFASEVEDKFLDYTKLTDAFNRVLKEQNLDEDSPRTLDQPAFYATSLGNSPNFRSVNRVPFRADTGDIPITATHNVIEPVPVLYNAPAPQNDEYVRLNERGRIPPGLRSPVPQNDEYARLNERGRIPPGLRSPVPQNDEYVRMINEPARIPPLLRSPALRTGEQRGYDTQADYSRRQDQFFRQGRGSKPQYGVKY